MSIMLINFIFALITQFCTYYSIITSKNGHVLTTFPKMTDSKRPQWAREKTIQ